MVGYLCQPIYAILMPSCCHCCCCCRHDHRRGSQVSVGRLNYDGAGDGQPNFQLQNLVAEWDDDGYGGEKSFLKFRLFENGGGVSASFMPPVMCRVSEMQRVCSADDNVCYIVPVQDYAKVVAAETVGASSEINVFEGNPTAHLLFKNKRGRVTLRVILDDACYAFVQAIPAGTQLCWTDGDGRPTVQWWNSGSWGSSMSRTPSF